MTPLATRLTSLLTESPLPELNQLFLRFLAGAAAGCETDAGAAVPDRGAVGGLAGAPELTTMFGKPGSGAGAAGSGIFTEPLQYGQVRLCPARSCETFSGLLQ